MLKRQLGKLLALVVAACYVLTAVAPAMAVDEPNPEGIRQGDRVNIDFWKESRLEDGDYKCLGIWDIKVEGVPKGKSLYFQYQGEGHGGANMIHPSKVMEWVKEFNGSENYVSAEVAKTYNTIRYGGGSTQRIHVRDLAELCGMHYYDSVSWAPGAGDVHPTPHPQAYLSVPAAANPGMTLKWKARGESYVQSRFPERRERINYTVKVDGKIVVTKALNTKSFSAEGTFAVPKDAKSGTKVKFELAVSDGVFRNSTVTQEVMVQEGQVNPEPPDPPEPPEPPAPPPPPDFEPEADFTISNPAPVEGEPVVLRDASVHPGKSYGESIVSWQWDIEKVGEKSGQQVQAVWNEAGTYKITLTVEDQDGDSDSCTRSVVVGPAKPAAVISVSTDNFIMGREFHVDGDQSTAAAGREIKWDEMEWKFYGPDGMPKYSYIGRYPLGKGTPNEKDITNSVLNQTGRWKITLRVKDTADLVSDLTEREICIHPDNPPQADFWAASETVRHSYRGNELRVRDLSICGVDGSLGDEIFRRDWTLFYDGNNDGDFEDEGDEMIKPGFADAAAAVFTDSDNDSEPVIRFYKTGRFKLELSVQERYTAWGETAEGLSADTSAKSLEEKMVFVINLAPQFGFDIKKKTPADIVFAVDYTAEGKYQSLVSSLPEFRNMLEGGYITPETEVSKVEQGELAEIWKKDITGTWFEPDPYLPQWGIIKGISGEWYKPNTATSVNLETGESRGAFRTIQKNNDGTYTIVPHYYHFSWDWGSSSGWRDEITSPSLVDSNLNVIVPPSAFLAAFAQAKPAAPHQIYYGGNYYTITSYTLKDVDYQKDRSMVLVFEGSNDNKSIRRYVAVKLNSQLQPVVSQEIFTTYCYYNDEESRYRFVRLHSFPDGAQVYMYNAYEYSNETRLIIRNDQGVFPINLGYTKLDGIHYTPETRGVFYNSTRDGRFFIYTDPRINGLSVLNSSAQIVGHVPIQYRWLYSAWTLTYPRLIDYWGDGKMAAVFQDVREENGKNIDYLYFYLIDEATGTITDSRTYRDQVHPPADIGFIGWSGEWDSYGFGIKVYKVAEKTLGLEAYRYYSGKHTDSYTYYASVLTPDLNIVYLGEGTRNSGSGYANGQYFKWHKVNNNMFLLNRITEQYYGSNSNSNYYRLESTIYRNNGTVFMSLPYIEGNNYGSIYPYFERTSRFADNSFLVDTSKYYNEIGYLKWIKSLSSRPLSSSFLQGKFMILSNGSLVDKETGNTVITIPGTPMWNNEDGILLQGAAWWGQKQGLAYLMEILDTHNWDANRVNVLVSVMDARSFKDFNSRKSSFIDLLNNRRVILAVIAPDDSIKSQTEKIAARTVSGWWIRILENMSMPLQNLAEKIIAFINEEKGADSIVLVGQEVRLSSHYSDPEKDPEKETVWNLLHSPDRLGTYLNSSPQGYSILHEKSPAVPPSFFDKPGTYMIKAKARDWPHTNESYTEDSRAGSRWSSDSGSLFVIAHRKPVADFTVSCSSTTTNGAGLVFTDLSYDPDLKNTDPEGKKGIRIWEWQYRNKTLDESWKTGSKPPKVFDSRGEFEIRLRVQDVHGAWSDWSKIKSINVINAAPIAMFEPVPNPVVKGEACSLINHSWDPDGDQITECEWTIEGRGKYTASNLEPMKVTWNTTGNYTVTLRVRDSEGKWSNPYSSTVQVIYNNRPVAVFTLPTVGYSGERFTADGTASYDPDPEDRIELAYWQYKKPGEENWSSIYTQHRGDPNFLKFDLIPDDKELGIWTIRLVVEDSRGLQSIPVQHTIKVQEGWEISGYIVPETGERGRKMIVRAWAHRKNRPEERYQIDSMKAEFAYHDLECRLSARSLLEGIGIESFNMPYDSSERLFKLTYRVGEKVFEENKWPADGRYYIKVTGRKGNTEKTVSLPFNIKGNIFQRLYVRTYSW